MTISIIDPVTMAAVQAAIDGANGTREEGVISACVAAFGGGNVSVRVYDAAGTLLHTTVRGPWSTDTSGDVKRMLAGPLVSRTNHVAGAPATARLATASGVDVFQLSASTAGADLDFLSPIELDVPVDAGAIVLSAPDGLDTTVTPPAGDYSLFVTAETMDALVARASAGHADWAALRAWCVANLSTVWLTSNWAGTAESQALANFALAYMIGARIGDARAEEFGDKAFELWDSEPTYAPANQVHAFFGPKYRLQGTRTIRITSPTGTFPRGSTVRGRTSAATAELVTVAFGSGIVHAAIKNQSGTFVQNEVVEVVGNSASSFVFSESNRPVAFADQGYGSRFFAYLYGAMYFWMQGHPMMTASRRTEVEDVVKSIWDEFNSGAAGLFQPITGIGNYQQGHMIQEVVFGLILRERFPEIWTEALRRFRARTDTLRDIAKSSGWMPEGHSYNNGMFKEFAYCLLALRSMTTESIGDYDAFTRNMPLAIYMSLSNVNGVPWSLDDGFVDAAAGTNPTNNSTHFFTAFQLLYGAGSLQSQYVAAILSRRTSAFYGGNDPPNYWHKFLTHNTTETFSPATIPLAIGAGPLMAKASHSVGDTSVWCSAGAYFNSQAYQRRDNGSLRIARAKPLLVTCEYGLTVGWDSYASKMHQSYCSVHGRTTTTTIQQYPFNAGLLLTNTRPEVPASFLKPNAEYGPSHFEDLGHAVMFRVPYRTAFFRDSNHTIGPDLDRIARSVLFVRPGLVFAFDAFRQAEGQPDSYIRTNWHFPLEPGMPATANANRDVVVTNAPAKLWAHMSYPIAPATNTVELFDGLHRDSYAWRATPASTSRDQHFLHVFRAADVSGYSDPVFTDFTGTSVFGCLVSGLEASEGTQVCGVIVDNGTDTPPSSVSYSVAQTGACFHYVAGLKPNTSYTISESLAAGTATVSISEGAGATTGAGGVLRFEVA